MAIVETMWLGQRMLAGYHNRGFRIRRVRSQLQIDNIVEENHSGSLETLRILAVRITSHQSPSQELMMR